MAAFHASSRTVDSDHTHQASGASSAGQPREKAFHSCAVEAGIVHEFNNNRPGV